MKVTGRIFLYSLKTDIICRTTGNIGFDKFFIHNIYLTPQNTTFKMLKQCLFKNELV